MNNKWNLRFEEAKVLEELEEIIDKPIPQVGKIRLLDPSPLYSLGVKIKKNHIIELGLNLCYLKILPKSIGTLKFLQKLYIRENVIISIPESIGNLQSLKILDLYRNKLSSLPDSMGELKSLQILNLSFNQFAIFPKNIGNLQSLQELDLFKNKIALLPETITELKSLQKLDLGENQFSSFPELITKLLSLQILRLSSNQIGRISGSISNLNHLQELDLSHNTLTTLPKSIGKLQSLQDLDLSNNQLTTLPGSMWRLTNLESVELEDNKWENEWKEYVKRDIPALLDLCRQRASITVFLSHAVVDYELFHIKQISEFLEKQDEIYKVFYCEEDLTGNIDKFMNGKIVQSQILLFFASKKSLYKSEDCKYELKLAQKYNIHIIPIRGADISWKELKKRKLSREMGFNFEENNLSTFCQKLYNYILKFKREIHLNI